MKSIQHLDRLRNGDLLTETARQLESKCIRSPLLEPKCTKLVGLAFNMRKKVSPDIHGEPTSALHMCKGRVWESALPQSTIANDMQETTNDWKVGMASEFVHTLQVQHRGLGKSTLF